MGWPFHDVLVFLIFIGGTFGGHSLLGRVEVMLNVFHFKLFVSLWIELQYFHIVLYLSQDWLKSCIFFLMSSNISIPLTIIDVRLNNIGITVA